MLKTTLTFALVAALIIGGFMFDQSSKTCTISYDTSLNGLWLLKQRQYI